MWSHWLSLLWNAQCILFQTVTNSGLNGAAGLLWIGNISYYSSPPSSSLDQLGLLHTVDIVGQSSVEYLKPATIFWFDNISSITVNALRERRDKYETLDDVFCQEFLEIVFFALPQREEISYLPRPVHSLLSSWGTKSYSFLEFQDSELLPESPYFTTTKRIHQAFRIYPDPQSAFVTASTPDSRKRFR